MLRIDSETWPINENEFSLQRVEIRMIAWTCDMCVHEKTAPPKYNGIVFEILGRHH